jgi:hypothetical protein
MKAAVRRAGIDKVDQEGVPSQGDDQPRAHLTNRVIPTNAQPMANRPEAIISKTKRMPAPAVNPTNANLPTTAKIKASPSQAHQGKSDGLINMASHYMLSIGPRG